MLCELTRGGLTYAALEDHELDLIRALADEKYRSWGWTYGASPPFQAEKSARYVGGSLGSGWMSAREERAHSVLWRLYGPHVPG
jgi:hypothetical protein